MRKPATHKKALDRLEQVLRRKLRETKRARYRYRVPALWASPRGKGKETAVNPYAYYLGVVQKLKHVRTPRKGKPTGGEWTKDAVIYNMFVRTTTAYDHDGSGKLELPLNAQGFRETGTFLKALALLPYIKRLGANTIHLLPITAIGHDGNKGRLGSPYAIRNPYALDENLAEPSLGLDAATEFKAFVEAAHRIGLRVVVEFVFRTASKDGDWVKQHPDWFYWIRDGIKVRKPHSTDESMYGSPIFTPEELARIHSDVNEHRLDNLLPPHQQYRNFFTEPPAPHRIVKEDGRYVGTLSGGRRVKIPGAFADWPPDDNQPPWGDVTYLRMYTHPDFNYIGYNTIRMYDTRLARPENITKPLWEKILGIIPHYQKQFHIDGVMIDMGHALPRDLKAEMVRRARASDHDFAFWDENFSVTARSREEGYNAVIGYCWIDQHHRDRMRNLCWKHAGEGFPIPYFSTPESHNTPRAAARPGGPIYARWAMVINAFLPAIPFLHSGYELAERYPINTGLDFSREELAKFPSEDLPLFSEYAYDWCSAESFTKWVGTVLAVRKKFAALVADQHPSSFRMLDDPNPNILAFARVDGKRIAIITNANFQGSELASVHIETGRAQLTNLLTRDTIHRHGDRVQCTLGPGECLVFEY